MLDLAGDILFPKGKASLLTGEERLSGRPLALLLLGMGGNQEFILNRLFARPVLTKQEKSAHPFACLAWCRRIEGEADLIVMDLKPPHATMLPGRGWLRLPPWIKQKIALPDSMEEFMARLPRKTRREVCRCYKRYGYSYDLVDSEDDFRTFYHKLYSPFIRTRFGREAIVVEEKRFLAECRMGMLMRLLRDGRPLGGALLQKVGTELSSVWVGFATQEEEMAAAPGAADVLDFLTLSYAFDQKCRIVDFGPSRPLLDDGVFRYKRKWGTRLFSPRLPSGEIRLRPLKMTAAVRSILENNPWIVREQGLFYGHLLVDGQELSADRLEKIARQAGRGIEAVLLKSLSGFTPDIRKQAASIPEIRLVDLSGSRLPAEDLTRFFDLEH